MKLKNIYALKKNLGSNIKPDWVVIENVPGLKSIDKGFFIEKICNDLHELGYTPNFKMAFERTDPVLLISPQL